MLLQISMGIRKPYGQWGHPPHPNLKYKYLWWRCGVWGVRLKISGWIFDIFCDFWWHRDPKCTVQSINFQPTNFCIHLRKKLPSCFRIYYSNLCISSLLLYNIKHKYSASDKSVLPLLWQWNKCNKISCTCFLLKVIFFSQIQDHIFPCGHMFCIVFWVALGMAVGSTSG